MGLEQINFVVGPKNGGLLHGVAPGLTWRFGETAASSGREWFLPRQMHGIGVKRQNAGSSALASVSATKLYR